MSTLGGYRIRNPSLIDLPWDGENVILTGSGLLANNEQRGAEIYSSPFASLLFLSAALGSSLRSRYASSACIIFSASAPDRS